MIVQSPDRPTLPRRSAANRELAFGLVLLALLTAGLVQYTLGYACRGRTTWPCRAADSSRGGPAEPLTPTLEAEGLMPPPAPVLVPSPGWFDDVMVPDGSTAADWPPTTPADSEFPVPGAPTMPILPLGADQTDSDGPADSNIRQAVPLAPSAPGVPVDTPDGDDDSDAGRGAWPVPPSPATNYPGDVGSGGGGVPYP